MSNKEQEQVTTAAKLGFSYSDREVSSGPPQKVQTPFLTTLGLVAVSEAKNITKNLRQPAATQFSSRVSSSKEAMESAFIGCPVDRYGSLPFIDMND